MRWLFLIVLFLNLAYIGWQVSLSSADSYKDVAPLKGVPPIMLLSEMQSPSDEQINAEVMDAKQQAVKNSSKQKIVSDKVDKKQIEISKVAVKKAPPVTTAKTLSAAKQPSPLNASANRCFTLGPFRHLDKLSGLTQEIKSYVVTTNFRGREEAGAVLYWVYVKPEKNRKQAVATGNRLKAKKIKDFYVIKEGEQTNGLSLGRFRNKDGAYRLRQKVEKLGFNVRVEPTSKNYTLYWLDYQLAEGKNIPGSIFEKYIKSTKKDKISRLPRNCGVR